MASNLRFILKHVLVALTIISMGCILLWAYQDKLIYPNYVQRYPKDNEAGYRDPGERKLGYEDVNITSSKGLNLHGWLIKTASPSTSPTIVMFHGNAGNIGDRLGYVERLYKWCNSNVIIVGYRGYSYSEGTLSEKGFQKDSIAIIDYAFSRGDVIDTSKIYLLGSSIGGAVAIYAQSVKEYNLAGIILENTFTNMPEVVDQVMPAVSSLKWLVLANYWPSDERITKIKVPILFITGLEDEMIPPEMMVKLHKAAVDTVYKEVISVPNGMHNDTWYVGGMELYNKIKQFMDKVQNMAKKQPDANKEEVS